jgi:aminoglycoside/choline kinase family phosphotransferase
VSDRAARRDAFLASTDWRAARVEPLAGDASPRRYFRVRGGPAPAVLMDADPDSGEDIRPFAAITTLLRDRGLSAPSLLEAEPDAGLLLIEDLGDDLFATLCARDIGEEPALYEAAVDLLAALHADPPPPVAPATPSLGLPAHEIPPYDAATLLRETRLVADWWTPLAAEPLSPDALAAFDAAVLAACAPVADARGALVLRDFHAENLLWLPQRGGHARVGLLDYQDALRGHPVYDLISLVEDARRDVSPTLAASLIARYRAAAGMDRESLGLAAAVLAAQRNLKIVGIFARLAKRDGKARYLSLIPRVWAHVRRDLAHPALAPLAALVDRLIPVPEPGALARAAARAAP